MADIDINLATRAMFNFGTDATECADVLFADTVRRDEYANPDTSP